MAHQYATPSRHRRALLSGQLSLAPAQIQVSAQTERSDFLLYERVDLLVTVANIGENDLVLDNSEGHPWLSFLVSKHNRLPVRPERQASFKPVTLKVGESKTLRINLTPLFSFREEGDYKAAAVINLPGQGEIMSDGVPFTVLRGRQVWTQTRPVAGTQRVYSLIRFSPQADLTKLYLRVEDPSENIVLANLALGDVVAYVDPDVYFDPQGNLHVLQPIAMSTYLYTRANPEGKIMHQTIFKSAPMQGMPGIVPPRLHKLEDGSIIVMGGAEEDIDTPQETLPQARKPPTRQPRSLPRPRTLLPASPPTLPLSLPLAPPPPDRTPPPDLSLEAARFFQPSQRKDLRLQNATDLLAPKFEQGIVHHSERSWRGMGLFASSRVSHL